MVNTRTRDRAACKKLADSITRKVRCYGRPFLAFSADPAVTTSRGRRCHSTIPLLLCSACTQNIRPPALVAILPASFLKLAWWWCPQVNARYSKLEIALDGVYKVILLLKKKKYAAIKFETGPDGQEREVRVQSGFHLSS